jgi:hypothetical protein
VRIGDLALLGTNLYDVYPRLAVEGCDLESALGYNPLISATWTVSADQLATQGQIVLFHATPFLGNQNLLSQILSGGVSHAGRYFELQTAVVAKGGTPGTYQTVFDGRIDAADGAAGQSTIQLTCRDMMACFLNRIIEPAEPPETPDGKNGFLVPSASLLNHLLTLRSTVYTSSQQSVIEQELAIRDLTSIGDPEWTVVDTWVQYGQNLAEQMNQAVLQRGWAFHYRYNEGPQSTADFTIYDPGRTFTGSNYTVQPSEVIRVVRCTINDQDVTNVWDLIWGRGTARTRTRAKDDFSIFKYGRRYGSWPEDQAGQIDTLVEAERMLEGMLADTKDPIVELDYERLYFWPVELADKHHLIANGINTDVSLDLSVVGYTHTLTPKSMRTVIRTRGTAIAAKKRWKRGSPRMVHVGLDPALGIMPEHAIVLTVDDLTPP